MKKKRSFSLLEVIVACILTAVISTFFLSQLKAFTLLFSSSAKEKQKVLQQNFFIHKFNDCLHHLTSCDFSYEQKENQNHLSWKMDSVIDIDPNFQQNLKGSLYVDNSSLWMSIESISNPGYKRSIHLIDYVNSLNIEFFLFDEKKKKLIKKTALPQKHKNLAIIALKLKMKDNSTQMFHFFAPYHHQITYEI